MRVEIKVDSLAICQHLGKFSSNFNFNWLFEENTGSNSQENHSGKGTKRLRHGSLQAGVGEST